MGDTALDAVTRWARDDIEAPMRARRRIAIGIALSLLVHGLLLVLTPRRMPAQGAPAQSVQGPLEVRLIQAEPPLPAQAAAPQPDDRPKPRPVPRRDTVIAALKPAPQSFPRDGGCGRHPDLRRAGPRCACAGTRRLIRGVQLTAT